MTWWTDLAPFGFGATLQVVNRAAVLTKVTALKSLFSARFDWTHRVWRRFKSFTLTVSYQDLWECLGATGSTAGFRTHLATSFKSLLSAVNFTAEAAKSDFLTKRWRLESCLAFQKVRINLDSVIKKIKLGSFSLTFMSRKFHVDFWKIMLLKTGSEVNFFLRVMRKNWSNVELLNVMY